MEAHFTTARMAEREDDEGSWEDYWGGGGGEEEKQPPPVSRAVAYQSILSHPTPSYRTRLEAAMGTGTDGISAWDHRTVVFAAAPAGQSPRHRPAVRWDGPT